MGNVGLSHQFTPTFAHQRQLQPLARRRSVARPQHQCAAERRPSGPDGRQCHAGRVDRLIARPDGQRRRELQHSRRGGCSSSPTTPGSNSGAMRTAPFALPANSYDPGADWGPVAGVARHNFSGDVHDAVGQEHPSQPGGDETVGHAVQHHDRRRMTTATPSSTIAPRASAATARAAKRAGTSNDASELRVRVRPAEADRWRRRRAAR